MLHVCTICCSAFPKPSLLEAHNRIHTGERPFKCERCGKTYTRNQHLRRHNTTCSNSSPSMEAVTHNVPHPDVSDSPKKVYHCPKCESGPFRQKKMVWAHLAIVHRERKHVCDKCRKSFPTLSKLNRHAAKHHGYSCSQCVNNHSGSESSIKFDTFTELRRHISSEHPKPQLSCSVCHRRFTRPSTLAEHELTHTPGGPEQRRRFVCSLCPNSLGAVAFTVKRNLCAHLRSAHADSVFPCTWSGCSVILSTNQKLSQHLSRHKANQPLSSKTRKRRHRIRPVEDQSVECPIAPDDDGDGSSENSITALLSSSAEESDTELDQRRFKSLL